MNRRSVVTLATTAVVVVVAVAITAASMKHYDKVQARIAAASASGSVPSSPGVVRASLPATPASYLGVYEGSALTTTQYSQVVKFGTAIGREPNLDLYYSSWDEGFSIPFAQTALKHGGTLVIDMDPTSTSCASIAAGYDDTFLEEYAESVKAFGHPVVISFGHEMNGNWYSWGWTQTPPAQFVQAWRHVVDVFRKEGADNVTWLWTVNSIAGNTGPIADYWPGANYVTWVGMDNYYFLNGDTFSGVFGATITAVRQITNKPILIAETAIGQVAGQAANIPALFAGVKASGLLGFVWFDQAQNDGLYHQDWRLEGHPDAIAAFRTAAATYLQPPPEIVAPASPSKSATPS